MLSPLNTFSEATFPFNSLRLASKLKIVHQGFKGGARIKIRGDGVGQYVDQLIQIFDKSA